MPRAPLWHESGSAPRSIFCPGRPPGGAGAGAVGGESCEHTVGQPRRLLCVSAGPGALGDSVETGPGLSLWRGSLVVLFPEMSSAGCPGREVSALHSPTQSQWLSVSRLWVRVGSFSVDAHEVSVPGARGCSGQLAPGCCSGGVSTVCSPGRPCLLPWPAMSLRVFTSPAVQLQRSVSLLPSSVGTFARALDCSSSVRQPSLHMSAAAASRDITLVSGMPSAPGVCTGPAPSLALHILRPCWDLPCYGLSCPRPAPSHSSVLGGNCTFQKMAYPPGPTLLACTGPLCLGHFPLGSLHQPGEVGMAARKQVDHSLSAGSTCLGWAPVPSCTPHHAGGDPRHGASLGSSGGALPVRAAQEQASLCLFYSEQLCSPHISPGPSRPLGPALSPPGRERW